ncbi:MAG: hypothetical protein ACO34E_12730, partial [Limisphaerales bacterium]
TNTVSVGGVEVDVAGGDNAAEAVVEVVPAADLGLLLSGQNPVLPGQINQLEVVLTNSGPSLAESIVVVGVDGGTNGHWQGVLGTPEIGIWSTNSSGGWEWLVKTLEPNGVIRLGLEFNGYDLGDWTNRVEVTAVQADSDLANNMAYWVTHVRNEADLALQLELQPGESVLQGGQFSLVLSVTNSGPDLAENVWVGGTLPGGVTLLDVVGDGGVWMDELGGFRWDWGDLDAGGTAGVVATYSVDVVGTWTNATTVGADQVDLDPVNNSSEWALTVRPAVGLGLILPDNSQWLVGDAWVESVVVTNSGPSEATALRVVGNVPDGMGLDLIVSEGTASNPGDGSWAWEIPSLGVGSALTVELHWRALADGGWTNQVHVAAAEDNLTNGIASGEWLAEVLPVADLAVGFEAQSMLLLGENSIQRITVTNAGPSAGSGVEVRGILPDGVAVVLDSLSVGEWTGGAGIWTWNVGDLAVGNEAVIQLQAEGLMTGTWTNLVMVSGSDEDPVLDDNTVEYVQTVQAASDLGVSIRLLQDLVIVGRPAVFELSVTNGGPDTAEGVLVTNAFVGASLLEYNESGAVVVTNPANEVVWSISSLPVGDVATLQVILLPTQLDGMTNTLQVAGDVVDAVPENDAFEMLVAVNPLAELLIEQTSDKDRVMVGDQLSYQIRVTSGAPYPLEQVVLRDTLPAGAQLVTSVVSQGQVSVIGDLLTADLGGMAPGEIAVLDLVIRPQVVGWATNAVQVIVDEADPFNPAHVSSGVVSVVAEPPMDIELNGVILTISWPGIASGYQLQRADSLSSMNWQADAATPRLSADGNLWQVVLRPTSAGRFYRLVRVQNP